MAETVGFSPSQIIPKNSLLRLTFGIPFVQVDWLGRFPASMTELWAKLPIDVAHGGAALFPSTPANVVPNSKTATIDARVHADRLGTELINRIAQLTDVAGPDIIELKRIELLTPGQVAVANTQVGALARDAATQTEAAKAAADSPWTKITTALTLASSTVKWGAAAIILLVLVALYYKAKR